MSWKIPFLIAATLGAVDAGAANPTDCLAIHLSNFRAPDGDYVIEPVPGRAFTVYCRGMATWSPAEYLTLMNTGGDYNFGQYTAGGASPGTSVRTSFTKVRIDPATLLVDIGDLTFATSTGSLLHSGGGPISKAPYGVALGCYSGAANGIANIDLTGTPFQVSQSFVAHGWGPKGAVSLDGAAPITVTGGYPFNGVPEAIMTGKVLNITGGGYCGSAGPRGVNSNHGRWLVPTPGIFALQLEYVGQ